MKYLLTALVSLTLFISCKKESNVDYVSKNEQDIKDYIALEKLNATRTDSGLYYVINDSGTGKNPTAASKVTVAYKGYFIDGNVFDKSDDAGISFNLDQVIKGWTEGIQYLKPGGSGVLLIPAHLGYGNNNINGIPGGSVLIFDVKLNSIN